MHREAWRGGAVDRGPARTALCRSRGRVITRLRATLRGITWWLRRGPKQEVRRQAKLHLVGASGKRFGRLPCLAAARPRAQDEPAFTPCAAMRAAAQRCAGATQRCVTGERNRESISPQGARVQESVAEVGETHLSRNRRASGGEGIARSDQQALDGAGRAGGMGVSPIVTGQARGERQGAGRGRAREQRALPSPLGSQGSGRADGRCSGSSGGCRSKPTAATAGLAWW